MSAPAPIKTFFSGKGFRSFSGGSSSGRTLLSFSGEPHSVQKAFSALISAPQLGQTTVAPPSVSA